MDPQVQTLLDELAILGPPADPDAPEARWLADYRYKTALLRTFSGDPDPGVAVTHHVVSAAAGPLSVRLFRPSPGRLPLLLHVHGGGGIAGTLDDYDPALRALASATGWLVAAPEYRLAPEHRFPAQIVDVSAALDGMMEAVDEVGFQAGRIVVSGDSLGAAIAFSVADMAQSREEPPLMGAMLLYPNTDLRADASYPSRRSEDGKIISALGLERQIQLYIRDAHRADPLASPITTTTLSQRPPMLIVTCEHDPLRDEGEALVARLREAEIKVAHSRLMGQCHGLLQFGGRVKAAADLLRLIADWLSQTSTAAS